MPNAWPVVEALALLPLLPADLLSWVSPSSVRMLSHKPKSSAAALHVLLTASLGPLCTCPCRCQLWRYLQQAATADSHNPSQAIPSRSHTQQDASSEVATAMQVPAPVLSAAGSYSGLIIGFTIAKRLVSRLLPDVARTCRMWRQFLPIYLRCKWTAFRNQESKGFTAQVLA